MLLSTLTVSAIAIGLVTWLVPAAKLESIVESLNIGLSKESAVEHVVRGGGTGAAVDEEEETSEESTAQPSKTEKSENSKQEKKGSSKKTAVATKSIEGHTVPGTVCKALTAVGAAGGRDGAVWPASPELLAATEKLAESDSPFEASYAAYVDLLKTDVDGTLDAAQIEVVTDFIQALRVDTATCV